MRNCRTACEWLTPDDRMRQEIRLKRKFSLQFDPAPRAGEPMVSRRVPDYFLVSIHTCFGDERVGVRMALDCIFAFEEGQQLTESGIGSDWLVPLFSPADVCKKVSRRVWSVPRHWYCGSVVAAVSIEATRGKRSAGEGRDDNRDIGLGLGKTWDELSVGVYRMTWNERKRSSNDSQLKREETVPRAGER